MTTIAYLFSGLILTLICVDRKQFELAVVIHAVFLGEHEYEAPKVAYEPCVDAVVSFVSSDKNFWHVRNQTLETESLKMLKQLSSENWVLA